MRITNGPSLIAAGYGLAIVGGLAAVGVVEALTPDHVSRSSGSMVAFGDMLLFVLVAGVLALAPTWLLFKLCAAKTPRALLVGLLMIAAIGPACWLAVAYMPHAAGPGGLPHAAADPLGVLVAFGAIPRMALGPALLIIEAAAFVLVRERVARILLAGAMTMDLVPLGMFALHLAAAAHR